VEVRIAESTGGEPVDVGSLEIGAVAAELSEAQVIEEDDHHVGSPLARVRGFGPPRFRVGEQSANGPLKSLVVLHGLSLGRDIVVVACVLVGNLMA
jgi:hypothetical protein